MKISLGNVDATAAVSAITDEELSAQAAELASEDPATQDPLEEAREAKEAAATLDKIADAVETSEQPGEVELDIQAAAAENVTRQYGVESFPQSLRTDKVKLAKAVKYCGQQLRANADAACEGFFDSIAHGMGKLFSSKAGIKPKFDEAMRRAQHAPHWRTQPFYNVAFIRDFPSKNNYSTAADVLEQVELISELLHGGHARRFLDAVAHYHRRYAEISKPHVDTGRLDMPADDLRKLAELAEQAELEVQRIAEHLSKIGPRGTLVRLDPLTKADLPRLERVFNSAHQLSLGLPAELTASDRAAGEAIHWASETLLRYHQEQASDVKVNVRIGGKTADGKDATLELDETDDEVEVTPGQVTGWFGIADGNLYRALGGLMKMNWSLTYSLYQYLLESSK